MPYYSLADVTNSAIGNKSNKNTDVAFFPKDNRKQFILIFIIAFLNLIGFGMIIPLLPHYARSFRAGIMDTGLLVASYAAAQFIGSPIWGRLSDKIGRRPVLIITLAGSVVGYILFGLAGSLWLLFVSRILSGFMSGNISVAQAYITDITDAKSRAEGLGIIGAAFGLGFILGPGMGGVLSVYGMEVPAYAAAGLNFFNLLFLAKLLPESYPPEKRLTVRVRRRFGQSLVELREALSRPLVGPLLYNRFFFSLAFAIFTTVFAIYAEFELHLSARIIAYLLTYVGVLMVLVQGVLIGRLTRRFAEGNLLFYSIPLMVAALVGWAFVRDVAALAMVLAPLALASGVFNTVINSSLSKAVLEEEVGGMLGLSMAIDSFTRILAPSAGSFLLAQFGSWAPGTAAAVLLCLVVPYAWRRFVAHPHPVLTSNLED